MINFGSYLWRHSPSVIMLTLIAWYLFAFTPNVSVRSEFLPNGQTFTFDNYSYKTFLGNSLCGKPSLAVIEFEDEGRNVRNVRDNAKGYGSGDDTVRLWRSTGTIPRDLNPGPVTVRKKVVYDCIFGSVRQVYSDAHDYINTR